MPDGSSRFDYQSIDPTRGLLFIAQLGASRVVGFDLQAQKVVANIPGVPSVHGVIVVPELHRVYMPLENVDGHPALRVFEPAQGGKRWSRIQGMRMD